LSLSLLSGRIISGSVFGSSEGRESGPAVLLSHLPGSNVGFEPFVLVGSEVDNIVVGRADRSVDVIAISLRSLGALLTAAEASRPASVKSADGVIVSATAVVLTVLDGTGVEDALGCNPSAAVGSAGAESTTVVTVDHAEIGIEHELIGISVAVIGKSPLVLGRVTVDGSPGLPALVEQRFVVIVVEDTLVGFVGPEARVAGVLDLGATNGVSTVDSGGESPGIATGVNVDVVNKDIGEITTSVLGVGEQVKVVSASLLGGSTVAEGVHELLTKGAVDELVGGVVISGSSNSDSLTSNDDEISKGDDAADSVVNLGETRRLHAAGKTGVVTIVEVHAAVRTVSIANTVVHEVVARESDEAASHCSLAEVLLGVEELDNSLDDALVLNGRKGCSRHNFVTRTGQDLRGVSGIDLLEVRGNLHEGGR
jgi:hypothetical protein